MRYWTALAALAGIGAIAVAGLVAMPATAKPDTLDGIEASTDPAIIARGKYLANGPAHCAACHTSLEGGAPNLGAQDLPYSGGYVMEAGPIGKWTSANLTSDPDTGLGKATDAEIVRALRYGVSRDGRTLVPFMPFKHMSDEDLTAILSYIRSMPPVKAEQPKPQLSPLGWVITSFVMKPQTPEFTPPKTSPTGVSVERGQYLANHVANCAGCHTKLDMGSMKYVGAPFSGGMELDAFGKPDYVLVTPNITPDPRTGRLVKFDEDTFVGRFKSGKGIPETHMPWAFFASMTDDDIRSIYRYLQSLPPVENETGDVLQKKKT